MISVPVEHSYGQGLLACWARKLASIFNKCSQQRTKQSCLIGRQDLYFLHILMLLISKFFHILLLISGQSSRSPPFRPGLQTTQPAGSGLFRTWIPGWTGNYGKHCMLRRRRKEHHNMHSCALTNYSYCKRDVRLSLLVPNFVRKQQIGFIKVSNEASLAGS